MKLMKSFLTLLLLGGMTFAGCNKDTPKEETPTEEGGGSSGGGSEGGSQSGGESGGEQGGGEQGGGQQGGGETVVDHFGDKKLVVVAAEPAEAPEAKSHRDGGSEEEEEGEMYICFFKDSKTAEMVTVSGDYFGVMLGTYTVNEAGTEATILSSRSYSGGYFYEFGEDGTDEYVIKFDESATHKYSSVIETGPDVYMTMYADVAEEAPSHAECESAAYVQKSTDDTNWSKVDLVMNTDLVQFEGKVTLAENEEFVIDLGTSYGGWYHYENYKHNPDTAGGKIVQGKENDDHSHNFKATAAGEYSIYVTFEGVYIVKDGEEPILNSIVYIETKGWFNSGNSNEHVYVYAFKSGSEPLAQNAAFPGEEATWVTDLDEGKKIFTFDLGSDYDTFIVVKVVDETPVYQTVDVSLSDLGDHNCIYLDAEAGSNSIPVGFYTYTPQA